MSASDSGRQLILWKWRQVHWHLYCDCHGNGVGSTPEQKILGELSKAKTTYRCNNQTFLSITNQKMGTLLASSKKKGVSFKPSHSHTFGYPIHSLIHLGERTPCFTEWLSTNSNLHVEGFWVWWFSIFHYHFGVDREKFFNHISVMGTNTRHHRGGWLALGDGVGGRIEKGKGKIRDWHDYTAPQR